MPRAPEARQDDFGALAGRHVLLPRQSLLGGGAHSFRVRKAEVRGTNHELLVNQRIPAWQEYAALLARRVGCSGKSHEETKRGFGGAGRTRRPCKKIEHLIPHTGVDLAWGDRTGIQDLNCPSPQSLSAPEIQTEQIPIQRSFITLVNKESAARQV